jgi:hypothetical protein
MRGMLESGRPTRRRVGHRYGCRSVDAPRELEGLVERDSNLSRFGEHRFQGDVGLHLDGLDLLLDPVELIHEPGRDGGCYDTEECDPNKHERYSAKPTKRK